MFVDWRSVNAVFCGVMWMLVVVLALVILVHQFPAPPVSAHHFVRQVVAR